MSAPYAIRTAIAADAATLQEIYAAAITNADWLPPAARVAPDFAAVSKEETIHVAVADDGGIAGFISVQPQGGFVHHLFVRADRQRHGVGRLLLASLTPWLPPPWRLKCVRANRGALTFYGRLGWREIGGGESTDGSYALLEWQSPQ